MRYSLLFVFLLMFEWPYVYAQTVPEQLSFCGMELMIDAEARSEIQEYMKQIFQSPPHFNRMVKRADMYMPFIEEAFRDEEVPLDLRFLAIQESGLMADAVSKSNAVGFWQFKEGSGQDMGLMINGNIDERKHIYRSSKAAAQYFKLAYENFNNWIYAVLGFKEGLTGALDYVEEKYYGKRRMPINKEFHWYILKFIAHKLAYEEALELSVKPEQWLVPFSSGGMLEVNRLYNGHGINRDRFFEFNQWMLNPEKLPSDRHYTYYIFRSGSFYPGHKEDPCKDPNIRPEPVVMTNLDNLRNSVNDKEFEVPATRPDIAEGYASSDSSQETSLALEEQVSEPTPSDGANSYASYGRKLQKIDAKPVSFMSPNNYVEFELEDDLQYGREYVYFDGTLTLEKISSIYKIRINDLLVWNRLQASQFPLTHPVLLYLKEPKLSSYHVVMEGENLVQIAALHQSSTRLLQKRNRMDNDDYKIYMGQKLYLVKKKPKQEKVIVLKIPVNEAQIDMSAQTDAVNMINSGVDQDETMIQARNGESSVLENLAQEDEELSRSQRNEEMEHTMSSATKTAPPTSDRTSTASSSGAKWVQHEVEEGENLTQIADQYNISVDVLKMINRLENEELTEGQILRVLVNTKKELKTEH